jgi:RNA polymerase sigma-70 factor (ECF subfamily)
MKDESELRDLGRALKARRAEAWERLYALTSLPLLRALRRALGDPALAEEALQAAFVTAIEMVDRFDPAKGSPDAWVLGIARNQAREALRARRGISLDDGIDTPAPETNGNGTDAEMVALVLDRLDPRYAEVLRRKYLAGEDLECMARELKLKRATVGTLLHRGRERFKEIYQRLQRKAEKKT